MNDDKPRMLKDESHRPENAGRDIFPFLYFGLWWLVGGGFLILLSLLGWATPPLTFIEICALSIHGFILGLAMNQIQSMGET